MSEGRAAASKEDIFREVMTDEKDRSLDILVGDDWLWRQLSVSAPITVCHWHECGVNSFDVVLWSI